MGDCVRTMTARRDGAGQGKKRSALSSRRTFLQARLRFELRRSPVRPRLLRRERADAGQRRLVRHPATDCRRACIVTAAGAAANLPFEAARGPMMAGSLLRRGFGSGAHRPGHDRFHPHHACARPPAPEAAGNAAPCAPPLDGRPCARRCLGLVAALAFELPLFRFECGQRLLNDLVHGGSNARSAASGRGMIPALRALLCIR